MTDQNIDRGFVKLYTPEGALVTIPLDLENVLTEGQAMGLLTSVRNIVAAGFAVREPGLEEGELTLEAAFVARRTASDQTPIIDFYDANPKLEKKVVHVYLNTPEDVAAFEKATALKLSAIPEWDGELAITKANNKAAKYILRLPRPVKIFYIISQKWSEWNASSDEVRKSKKEPMKKVITRYESNGHTPTTPQAPAPKPEPTVPPTVPTTTQPPAMTFAAACDVLSPGGKKLSLLTANQLTKLMFKDPTVEGITEKMAAAATIVLQHAAAQK